MRVVPMACVSFGTYELVHAWLAALDAPSPKPHRVCLPPGHRLLPYCAALAEADARQRVVAAAAAAAPAAAAAAAAAPPQAA